MRPLHANLINIACSLVLLTQPIMGCAAELIETIKQIKPAVVGIGTYQRTRSPALSFRGTGFAVHDGLHIVTNVHVIPDLLDTQQKEGLVVMIHKEGKDIEVRAAQQVLQDPDRDLVMLKIEGSPLPTFKVGNSDLAQEGQELAFTGYPIGMILGLKPVTHRSMLSAVTPFISPVLNSKQLTTRITNQLKKEGFNIFQLDGTAYPGNSGSPLYDPHTGALYGVINMVFIKSAKENAISSPSGISYAIPSKYVDAMIQQLK